MDSESSLVALTHLSETEFSHVEGTDITKHTRLVFIYFSSSFTLNLWYFALVLHFGSELYL